MSMRNFPDPTNPRHVRALFDNAHTAYVRGDTDYPLVRPGCEPQAYPAKTQPIAELLAEDWRVIDEDRSAFKLGLTSMAAVMAEKGQGQRATVISGVGRNVVNVAMIENGQTPTVFYGAFPRRAIVDALDGASFKFHNGTSLDLNDPSSFSQASGFVVGQSYAAGVFGLDAVQSQRFMDAMDGSHEV